LQTHRKHVPLFGCHPKLHFKKQFVDLHYTFYTYTLQV
jgi:hypothetical protein